MTEPLRLLVLNCEYPPLGGGAATATLNILKRLEACNVQWDLVTASPSEALSVENRGRCAIHYLPVGKKALHYWSTPELMRYAVAAARYSHRLWLRRRHVICHAFFTLPAGAAAWRLRRLMPYLVSLRGSDVPGFSGRFDLFHTFTAPITRLIWRNATAVVANSQQLRTLALQCDPGQTVEVIPNGVDTQEFKPGAFRPSGRSVLVVARLIPRKDVATAVRAVAALRGKIAGLTLTVVGDGPDAQRIQALGRALGMADALCMCRAVPRELMSGVYRGADVFLLTSRREGMSNTVLEALASGLPIVASPEAMAGIDFPEARLVPPADAAAAAEAVEKLLLDEGARRTEAAAARRAAGKYDWDRVAGDYLHLYKRLIARAKEYAS